MLMPSIFGGNLLDDFFDYSFGSRRTSDMVNTDVRDTGNNYEITMNMPGAGKGDVKAELKDGYLTIQATTDSSRDEKDSNGTYIRRERYCGSYSRGLYVSDTVIQEDIKAEFEDGTLKVLVPKREAKPAVEEKKYIAIGNQTRI